MIKKPIFIAEIKTQSMFGFKSKYSREHLIETAINYGSWISIHTDPRFGGSFDDIYRIRQKTNKPILAKGFHCHNSDIEKALDLGANYVLVVDRLNRELLNPPFTDKILFELSDLNNIEKVSYDFIEWGKFVYNGRDLDSGNIKYSKLEYDKYREKFNWVCGASFIETPDDVQRLYPNCDAFIVGEHLEKFCNNLKK